MNDLAYRRNKELILESVEEIDSILRCFEMRWQIEKLEDSLIRIRNFVKTNLSDDYQAQIEKINFNFIEEICENANAFENKVLSVIEDQRGTLSFDDKKLVSNYCESISQSSAFTINEFSRDLDNLSSKIDLKKVENKCEAEDKNALIFMNESRQLLRNLSNRISEQIDDISNTIF